MASRERLYGLVDQMPERETQDVAHYLESFHGRRGEDPVIWVLEHAPAGDDPLTPEEEAGPAGAWEDVRAGRFVSAGEARRYLLD